MDNYSCALVQGQGVHVCCEESLSSLFLLPLYTEHRVVYVHTFPQHWPPSLH